MAFYVIDGIDGLPACEACSPLAADAEGLAEASVTRLEAATFNGRLRYRVRPSERDSEDVVGLGGRETTMAGGGTDDVTGGAAGYSMPPGDMPCPWGDDGKPRRGASGRWQVYGPEPTGEAGGGRTKGAGRPAAAPAFRQPETQCELDVTC